MTHLFCSRSRRPGMRRVTAAIAVGVVAAFGMLAIAPSAMADGPAAAKADTVAAALGVKPVRAEIAVLVDHSVSMSAGKNNDLYPGITSELPIILDTLARQQPQDTVVLIKFAASAQLVYDGAAKAGLAGMLPATATAGGTNIGLADQLAIQTIEQNITERGIQAAGVLLLSDGELEATADTQYGSYDDPGWTELRNAVAGLRIKVTGYGLQLPTGKRYVNDISTALGTVFGNPVNIAKNTSDAIDDLETPGLSLMDSEIARAAAPDIGKGVRVSWSGLPGTGGGGPLNLTSAGHADVEVTLTATTQRVPLYLSGLTVESSGLSGAITGTLPAQDEVLPPGQPVPLRVHLTWQRKIDGFSITGSPEQKRGQLVLAGRVSSTFTQPLRYTFNDTSFSTGGLIGASSASFSATVPVFGLWLILVILAGLLLAFAMAVFIRSRMLQGTFTVTSFDQVVEVIPLSRWRFRRFVRTDDMIGIPGRMTVRRNLRGKRMKVGMQLENRPDSELELEPGGRTMISGIDILHDPNPGAK
jgi:hypothetical protein